MKRQRQSRQQTPSKYGESPTAALVWSLWIMMGTLLCTSSTTTLAFCPKQLPTTRFKRAYPTIKGTNTGAPTLDRSNKTDSSSPNSNHHGSLLFATSSRELKQQEAEELKARKPRKKSTKKQKASSSSSSKSSKQNSKKEEEADDTFVQTKQQSLTERLQKATAKAKAAAIQAEYSAKKQQLEDNGQGNQQPCPSFYPDSQQQHPNSNNQSKQEEKIIHPALGTLRQLTNIIDKELLSGSDGSKTFNVHGTTNPPPGITRDSMRSLLEENEGQFQKQQMRKNYHPDHVKHVAVIFSKPLIQDQVTLEYACRIRTLAKAIQQQKDNNNDDNDGKNDDDDGAYQPSLIIFVGERSSGNLVSDADAGYMFFRHLCAANQISLDGIDIAMQEKSLGRGALQYIMQHLRQDYIPNWLQQSSDKESATDEYGEQRQQPRKKVQLHFTLFSSDYDLCRLNDIHLRSPSQSLLTPLQEKHEAAGEDFSYASPYASPAASPINLKSSTPSVNGIVECSWSYRYASYPYVHFKDKVTSFLGKCYLLAEELTPVLVNIRGVVDGTEFFQRDNFRVLVSIRRSFVTDMERFYQTQPSLKATLREYVINSDYPLDVVLEGVLLNLGRCLDLVRPAGLLIGFVSKSDWKNAEILLENVIRQLRDACDPDQPLDPSEWGNLECHFDHPTDKVKVGDLTSEDLMALNTWRLQEDDE